MALCPQVFSLLPGATKMALTAQSRGSAFLLTHKPPSRAFSCTAALSSLFLSSSANKGPIIRTSAPLSYTSSRLYSSVCKNALEAGRGRNLAVFSMKSLRCKSMMHSSNPQISRVLSSPLSTTAPLHAEPSSAGSAEQKVGGGEEKNKDESDGEAGQKGEESGYKTGNKAVSIWLFTLSGVVFSLVVVGGLTRLTKSGLSMTDWRLQGKLPPMNEKDWEMEFEQYKQFPEWEKHNMQMTLDEFKFIFWFEYGHRMLGRLAGVTFALPYAFFLLTKRIPTSRMRAQIGLIGALILGQGLVGWWMVRSGLQLSDDEYIKKQEQRVSPYRLTTHLLSAFTIYSLALTSAMQMWPRAAITAFSLPRGFRPLAIGTVGLLGVTVASGAFVAGNGAGLVYNEFPKMGGRWIPEDIINPYIQPKWRNVFENHTLVQFDHRVLAMSTGGLVSVLYLASRRLPPGPTKTAASFLMAGTICQITLGISTLLNYVPVHLGSAHQAGALTLFSVGLWLLHSIRRGNLNLAKLRTVASKANAGTGIGGVGININSANANLGSQFKQISTCASSRPRANVSSKPCLSSNDMSRTQ